MLFKISKPNTVEKNENLTQVKCRFDFMEKKAIKSSKWISCFVTLVLLIITCAVIIPVLIWSNVMNAKKDDNGKCHYKRQNGICLTNSYCCDGEYIIGRDLCSGNGFCCLGKVDKCKEPFDNETELWSFSSLTGISSRIICRNVTEPIVEQAIVFSISAIEDYDIYQEISEKIGQELSYATGHKWYSIVGQKESFDMFLKQFEAYILITIEEIDLMLFRVDFPKDNFSDDNQIDYNFGVDTRPTIEILSNEMDETMAGFVTQTLDYILNSCFNNYNCVSVSIVSELNQQFGNDWQCIISSNTNELVADVQYSRGTFLELNYNNKHRIIVYRAVVMKKITETEVIENARKVIQMNSTVIIENYLDFYNTTEALNNIYRAVIMNPNFWSLCHELNLIYGEKYRNDWGCVAGVYDYFSRSIAYTGNNYIEIKLNQLHIILFERS